MIYEQYRVRDICDIRSGKRLPLGMELSPSETPYKYIRARDIKNGKISLDDVAYIDEATKQKIKKYIIETGDIAITIVANIGDVGYCSAVCNQANLTENAVRLTNFNKEIVNSKFLTYYLSQPSLKKYMEGLAVGAAQAKLGIYKIQKMKLSLPKLEVQNRIVELLSIYDELIENNNKRIKLLEQMTENLYKEWFVRFRFPGYENAEFENDLPKGWEMRPLSDVAEVIMGQSPSSDKYNDNKEGLPFHQGVGSYGDLYLKDDIYSTEGKKIAEPNSIIFSVRAPVGRININLNKVILGRGVASVNSKLSYNGFLLWQLKNCFSKEDIIGNGAIFTSVTKDELLKYKLIKPTDDLMKQFDEFATKIELQLRSIYLSNENLIKQRDLLLSRLMSGKLEV